MSVQVKRDSSCESRRLTGQTPRLHWSKALLLSLLFSLAFSLRAQFPNPPDFNTAANASATGTLPIGANDLHWTVALTSSVGPYVPAVSCGNPAPASWITSPYPNANWICPPRTCSTTPAFQCVAGEDDYFKLSFTLPATVCGEPIMTSYCLGLNYYADNCVTEIFVNGVRVYNYISPNPYSDNQYKAGYGKTISLCNYWQSGNNDVIVHTKTGPSYGGFLAQVTQTVVTAPYVPLSASISQINAPCSPFAAAIVTAGGGVPPYTYTWLPGGTNNTSVGNLSIGTYSCVVRDINNCAYTQTFHISSTGQAIVVVTAASAATICAGQSTTLNASGASSYTWMPGHLTGSSVSVSPYFSQTYSVLASNGTCTTSATQSVIVNPQPALAVHVTSLTALCNTTSATMNASGAGSYTWLPGNYTGNAYSVSITSSQNYTVIGTDGKCFSSAVQHVIVNQPPHVSLNVPSSFTLCAGQNRPISLSGADEFSWSPAATQDTGNVFMIHPAENTTYTITGNTGPCGSDTKTLSVTVHSVNAAFTDDSELATTTDAVSFTNLSSPESDYSWYFSWGATSSQKDPVVTVSDPGTYVACLLVKNNYGCLDTACKTIRIGCPDDAVFIPNTFTPNDDGLNDLFKVITLPACIDKFNLGLFDRWGQRVFSSDKLEEGWDGKIKGAEVKEDVYVYVAEYTMTNKKTYKRTGHLVLMK